MTLPESSCESFHGFIHIITYSIYVFSSENGGGGGGGLMNLVYDSSSSSYMDCEVNFDYECSIFVGLGFV